MSPADIRKRAAFLRENGLLPDTRDADAFDALADVQDAAKFYLLALNSHGMTQLREAVKRVEALEP